MAPEQGLEKMKTTEKHTSGPSTANNTTTTTATNTMTTASMNLKINDDGHPPQRAAFPKTRKIKTTWVAYLNKAELEAYLREMGMDPVGTVEDLRRRLSTFINAGFYAGDVAQRLGDLEMRHTPGTSSLPETTLPGPDPLARSPTYIVANDFTKSTSDSDGASPPTTSIQDRTYDRIRKWKLEYNGGTDPIEFIERVEEATTEQLTPDQEATTEQSTPDQEATTEQPTPDQEATTKQHTPDQEATAEQITSDQEAATEQTPPDPETTPEQSGLGHVLTSEQPEEPPPYEPSPTVTDTPDDDRLVSDNQETPSDIASRLQHIFEIMQQQLQLASQSLARHYKLRHRDWSTRIGQLVWVKEQPLSRGGDEFAAKFAPKYSGPFEIESFKSRVIVTVRSITSGRKRTTHVRDLKEYHTYLPEEVYHQD